jgi:hypothetical protein
MARNFGVKRNMPGGEMFSRFWHDNDNEIETIWPVAVFVAAVLAIVAIGIFIA